MVRHLGDGQDGQRGRFDCCATALNERWWLAQAFDRGGGEVRWVLSTDLQRAYEILNSWASRCAAMRDVNPYVPRWKPEGKLTDPQRAKQRRAKVLWSKENARRGFAVEEETKIKELVRRGALFAVSHSGGKDSQAMLIQVRKIVPDEQILVVHAPLKHVEWEGAAEQARTQTPKGRPFLLAEAIDSQGDEKWLLEWVLRRGKWPDSGRRWCTSDWKTGPIRRELRKYADATGATIIVEALGLRAQESEQRGTKPAFEAQADEHGKRSLKLGRKREWYKWLPIKWMSTDKVFEVIAAAGQHPLWTYQEGMTRASCAFCVLASQADLRVAAGLAPQLYATYVAIERIVDAAHRHAGQGPHTIKQGKTLEETTGVEADPDLVRNAMAAIQRTGDLSEVGLPDVVPRPSATERRRLRVLATSRPQRGQLKLFV